jgi:hypothetical protein
MSKPYTLPISLQDVDHFLEHSVFEKEDIVQIKNIQNPFLLLFVLYQEYISFEKIVFRGNITQIVKERAFEVLRDLDALLPQESQDDIQEMQTEAIALFEENKKVSLSAKVVNKILKTLRKESVIWSDSGVSDMLNDAFEYTLILSLSDFEILKKEISKIAHKDPQRDYEEALKVKRNMDIVIDRNIVFRKESNGKKDPSALLLVHIGANTYKYFEKLEPKQRDLVNAIFDRRFQDDTTAKTLSKFLNITPKSFNARKSSIDRKVQKHLKRKLFDPDTFGNIVFPDKFSCMGTKERERHERRHEF